MENPDYYRRIILEKYSWLLNKGQPMILHSDFDGIFSGMFLHEINKCYPIGFYDLKCIWISKKLYSNNIGDLLKTLYSSLWVDVDVYRVNIRSIGHHLLKFRKSDAVPGHAQSLNPNLVRGIYHGTFERKYPYGTIHFLMMIFNYQPEDLNPVLKVLLWHPDSSLANAQRYIVNTRDWLQNFLGIKLMIKTLQEIDTEDFERRLKEYVHNKIQAIGFKQGRSQIKTRYLQLGGYQCDFKNPNHVIKQLHNLIEFISDVMGWKEMEIPSEYVSLCGERSTIGYKEITEKYGGLDAFLSAKNPFSYAIPERNRLNYTIIPNI